MNETVATILWALLAFQIKHFLCDFALQTRWQISRKGVYGHPGAIFHAALHSVASIPALVILTGRNEAVAGMVVAEFVIHYHCDWLKARVDRHFGWTDDQQAYWVVFGMDQLIHQLTYLGIIFVMFHENWLRV